MGRPNIDWHGADAPVSLVGRSPAVRFRHRDPVGASGLVLRVGRSAEDCFTWTVLPDGWGRPTMYTTDEWVEVTLSFADARTVGAPDRSTVTYWDIGPVAADEPSRIERDAVGSMPEPEEFPDGIISLTFDDSFASQFEFAFPAMTAVGLRGTLAPIIERLDTPEHLTADQVRTMAAGGWEISPHALTDASHQQGLHQMTEAQREAELTGLKAWHGERGYSTDTYSYPGGWYTAEAGAHALRHYTGVRSAYSEFTETWPPAQPDRIRAVVVTAETHPDLEAYRAEIARVKRHRCWTVLVFHSFSADGDGTPYETRTETFAAFCAQLADSGVAVLTMREVLVGRTTQ